MKSMRVLEEASVDAMEFMRKSIADDLRTKREAAGLTQAKVAKRAGMRQEVLSRIENGHGKPTVSSIKRILKAIHKR